MWLKMNIDSCECPLTEAIVQERKVRIVVMETNHDIPPPIIFCLNYSPDTRFCVKPHAYYGCSLQYQVNMLDRYGYQLIAKKAFKKLKIIHRICQFFQSLIGYSICGFLFIIVPFSVVYLAQLKIFVP